MLEINVKPKYKKGDERDLDTLMLNCGYHGCFDDCNCNNGYGCLHPGNSEDYNCPNGCKGCFAWSCPIAYQKDPDKDEENCAWGSDTIMVITQDIY